MRLLVTGIAALVLASVVVQAQSSDAYIRAESLRGHISCAASAAALSTDDQCGATSSDNRQRFQGGYEEGLTGLLVEIAWTPASTSGPRTLRVEFSMALDEGRTTSWEGQPRGRIWLYPIDPGIRNEAGALEILVVPSESATEPSLVVGQPFELATTFVYGEYTLPENYSALGLEGPVLSVEPDEATSHADGSRPALVAAERAVPVKQATVVGVGALALAPLLVPRLRHGLSTWAGVLLFSRLDEDRILDHPRRAELFDLVCAQPGVAVEPARARLGIGRGAFAHHLRILELRRLVRRVHVDGRVLVYPNEGRRRPPPMATGTAARLLEAVRDSPGRRQVDLAAQLAVPERTVRHHALWLARRGRLRLVNEGRAVLCYPIS